MLRFVSFLLSINLFVCVCQCWVIHCTGCGDGTRPNYCVTIDQFEPYVPVLLISFID